MMQVFVFSGYRIYDAVWIEGSDLL